MSTPFQNRLVGTIIVAAAAVIFLPDLLDGEQKSFQQQFEDIPKAPTFEMKAQTKSFPQDSVDAIETESLPSDEKAKDQQLRFENTPETPDIATVTINEAESQAMVANTEQSIESDDAVEETSNLSQLTDTDKNVVAWVIQLGSFRSKDNVDSLLKKLKTHNFTAFSKPIVTGSGELTQVYVGPDINKNRLTGQLAELKRLTNVQGKITQFKPE